MATLHQGNEGNIIYVKGSPERVSRMCHSQLINGSIESLRSEQIWEKADEMAREALRVLGMAYKTVPKEKTSLTAEDLDGLIFLGLQGMIDPPREEAVEAVGKCKRSGIRTVMITGDHAQTAKAIAGQLGIGGDGDKVLSGEELSGMSDEELYEAVDSVSVYARVAPEHKFRVATQLQKRGHIVAVTGDGVNDAPALKAADIGIAMGITGTDVSKEACDMVLVDDNFASIVSAVEEGRHIFENIRKAILYLLPTNGGQGLLVLGAVLLSSSIPLFAQRLPIEPIQILWINLIIAVACSLPLVNEVKEKGLLERPPRDPKEPIANRLFMLRVGIVSVVVTVVGFVAYYHFGMPALSSPVDELRLTQAQTAVFSTVILAQVFYLFTARSIMESVFTFSPFSNKWVLMGAAVTIGTMLMIIYLPPYIGINPFRTAPLPADWWITIVLLALPGLFVIELEKLVKRRLGKG
jgi:magnesium-transporting ATPase (P-type)